MIRDILLKIVDGQHQKINVKIKGAGKMQTIEKDQELKKLKKQTETVLEKAQKFELDSDEKLGGAAEVLSWIAAQKKKFEAMRIELVSVI